MSADRDGGGGTVTDAAALAATVTRQDAERHGQGTTSMPRIDPVQRVDLTRSGDLVLGALTAAALASPTECVPWPGRVDAQGYALASVRDAAGERLTAIGHRLVYATLVGPIPAGHDLDHECGRRECVNPAHLAPVTRAENNRRMMLARRVRRIAEASGAARRTATPTAVAS